MNDTRGKTTRWWQSFWLSCWLHILFVRLPNAVSHLLCTFLIMRYKDFDGIESSGKEMRVQTHKTYFLLFEYRNLNAQRICLRTIHKSIWCTKCLSRRRRSYGVGAGFRYIHSSAKNGIIQKSLINACVLALRRKRQNNTKTGNDWDYYYDRWI